MFCVSCVHVPGAFNTVVDSLLRDIASPFFSPPGLIRVHSSGHSGATGDNQTRLGVRSLDGLVHSLIGTTLRAYTSGKKCYMEFCAHFRLLPLPVSEVILLHFAAHLALLGLSYQTVKLYLSAVRNMQIMSNLPDPSVALYPRLSYALRGLRRRLVKRDSSPVFQLCWKYLL